jgi:DNA-binding XRE family transcriptional regulator
MSRTPTERTSPLYERLEAIRKRAGIESKTEFAKRIGLTPVKYDNTKDSQGITPSWEIALQAMELDGIDWIELD